MHATQKLLLSFAVVLTVSGASGRCQAATVQLVIPNAGFEDQGSSIDGDGDGIPLASDPADFSLGRIPGWVMDREPASFYNQSIGIFNPSGAGALGFTTTTAHSGNLVFRVENELSAYAPIRTTDGAAYLLGLGDVITVSGWIVEGRGDQTDVRFELSSLVPSSLTASGYEAISIDAGHVRDVFGSAWQPFSLTFTVRPAYAAYIGTPMAFSFNTESGMLLDDLSISAERVPEPASVSLAAAALFLAAMRRGRRI